jgi:hypothetical protein
MKGELLIFQDFIQPDTAYQPLCDDPRTLPDTDFVDAKASLFPDKEV